MSRFGPDALRVVGGRRRYNADRRDAAARRCALLLDYLWKPVKQDELARQFGVSRSTISRDLKRLRFMAMSRRMRKRWWLAKMTVRDLDGLNVFAMPKLPEQRKPRHESQASPIRVDE